jgi:hypothetical protein
MLPAVSQALQARQAAVRAAEVAARATHAAIEALLANGATFEEAAVVLALAPEEIAELTARPRGTPAARRTPDDRPQIGPSGLPQRSRTSGPVAAHQ